jgi:hypothetical protein
MGNVQSIPPEKRDTKFVSQAELDEFEAYRNGDDNLFEAGIRTGDEGFYDPTAGSKYPKNHRPTVTPGPVFATDPGQPRNVGSAKIIGRQPAVDKGEQSVLSSTNKGRKTS